MFCLSMFSHGPHCLVSVSASIMVLKNDPRDRFFLLKSTLILRFTKKSKEKVVQDFWRSVYYISHYMEDEWK